MVLDLITFFSFPNLPVPLKNESERNQEREGERGKERGTEEERGRVLEEGKRTRE